MSEERDSSQEKTEEATPRKRQMALEEGNVPRSRDLTSALVLLGMSLFMPFLLPHMGKDLRAYNVRVADWMARSSGSAADIELMLRDLIRTLLATVGPFVVMLASIALLVGLAQGRMTLSAKAIEPKIENLDPIANMKRTYGVRALANLVKQVFRLIVIGVVGYFVIRGAWPDIMSSLGATPAAVAETLVRHATRLLTATAGAYVLLAIADYGFEFWDHGRKLRMSHQEIHQEIKNTDGDPLIKQQLRERMSTLAYGSMMQDIPSADVVIVNPHHRAVALRYDPRRDVAPVVVAMGERKLALRIRRIAEEAGIEIVEDRALARALLRSATVGAPIPAELYLAVSTVAGYVWRAQRTRVSLTEQTPI